MAQESTLRHRNVIKSMNSQDRNARSVDAMVGVVMRMSFDSKQNNIRMSRDAISEAMVLRNEYINSCLEFAPKKVIVASRASLHIFDRSECIRVITAHQTSSNKYMKTGVESSMGYMWVLPGFDPEHFPFVAISGDKSIDIVNMNLGYSDPLVIAEQTCTWGQQAFFFKREHEGLSLNFTIGRKLDNGGTRLEWIRLPLKSDFMRTLARVGYMPSSDTQRSIKEIEELSDLKWLQKEDDELEDDLVFHRSLKVTK